MIGSPQKVFRLMGKLLIINIFLFISCKHEINKDNIQGVVINGINEKQKTLLFEIDDRQYDLFIDSSDDYKYFKLFITVKDKNSQNIYHISSSFINDEIISENTKNDNGFSIKYDLASTKSKLYTIPLSFDQLDFENYNDQLLILPPEF